MFVAFHSVAYFLLWWCVPLYFILRVGDVRSLNLFLIQINLQTVKDLVIRKVVPSLFGHGPEFGPILKTALETPFTVRPSSQPLTQTDHWARAHAAWGIRPVNADPTR
jgi:hypothetical protein